jgi:hypothetical protein
LVDHPDATVGLELLMEGLGTANAHFSGDAADRRADGGAEAVRDWACASPEHSAAIPASAIDQRTKWKG